MRVAIISDVHNNEVNLKKVLDYCAQEKIKTIICCGDLASKETLDFLCDNFSGEIHYTFGNMDEGQLRDYELTDHYKNTKIYKKFGETKIDGKNIAFVHYPNVAQELCKTGKYKFIFHGHTHKPWVASAPDSAKASTGEEATANQGQKKCTILNPGNVAGEIYPPTFAVWETDIDKFDLIRIHNLKI